MADSTLFARIEASLLCLAVTDALGGPLEFHPRRKDPSKYLTKMVPNDNFSLPAGHFTDDTSMALCLANSLIESRGVTDALSQATTYCEWYRAGKYSSTGKCFDIGIQTTNALAIWDDAIGNVSDDDSNREAVVAETLSQIKRKCSAEIQCGNGSLMRVLPCALVSTSEEQAIRLARESSDLTHPHPRCVDSCVLYIMLVYRALRGASKQDLFHTLHTFIHGTSSSEHPPQQNIDKALKERFEQYQTLTDFEAKPEDKISSSGYVLNTLEAALWVFFTTDTYREGAIKVVNLGDDADTVGAVYGGLAGAFYGDGRKNLIPEQWLGEMKAMKIVKWTIVKILKNFHGLTNPESPDDGLTYLTGAVVD